MAHVPQALEGLSLHMGMAKDSHLGKEENRVKTDRVRLEEPGKELPASKVKCHH